MPDKHLFASYTYTPIILITMWLSYSVIKATGGQNGDGGSVTSNLKTSVLRCIQNTGITQFLWYNHSNANAKGQLDHKM